MTDDATLLHRYVTSHDEAAFAEFVQRRIGLVYSAALRQLAGDDHLARDAAQLVFIDAARKARALARHPLLTGWLYTATHHAAAKLVRSEQRRRFHENKVHTMNAPLVETAAAPDWERLRPLLDAALRELGETDRSAILLRFFENHSFSVVGRQLRLSEDAARKRVDRALEKLHAALARRGVVSTSAALTAIISTQAVHAAPADLAQAVTVLAVKSAAGATLTAGTLAVFAWPKVQLGVAALLVAVVGTGVAREQATISTLRSEIAAAEQSNRAVRAASSPGGNSSDRTLAFPWPAKLLLAEQDYHRKWADLVRRLRLQPDTITALVKLDLERRYFLGIAIKLAERAGLSERAIVYHFAIGMEAIDAEFDERYHALVGREGYALIKEFQRTVVARNELGGFATAAANAHAPLSDLQMDALATLLTDSGNRDIPLSDGQWLPRPPGKIPYELAASQIEIGAPLPEEVLERARAILTPVQHEKLATFQSARLASREIEARNRAAATRGELRLNTASARYYPAFPPPPEAVSPGR
ncbi:MAG: sigma-70 family RNA polymerase sigma factor [Nibricoccus sp.]